MTRLLITPGTRGPAAPGAARQARADALAGRTAPGRGQSTGTAGERGTGTAGTGRRWVVLLVAGWLCQAGLRAWFGRMQVMPLANPDETAYLIAARVLAGGPGTDLSGSTLYPGGYPLLITPVYWFTSNPATVYHAVLMINAAISAAIFPLGYLACRRLGLDRPVAYGVAAVAALVPAAFFYSQYAMTDAVFPVITLAWLLATHSWLTASSARGASAAAAGSALLAGFAYMVHSRGLVMLAGYAAVGAFMAWRRPAARRSVAAAALIALATAGTAWTLNRYLASAIYPEGARSLSGQMASSLDSVRGTIHVFEMAAGQLWRLVLDSWGIAGIGLVAALAVVARRGVRTDLRIMAGLAVAVTAAIACTAPAALPSDQSQTWASGRYLDGMIITFFLAGAVVLLRAGRRLILGGAACATALFVLAAVTVAIYAGPSLPTSGFASAFNFAEPAVLTQNWTQASVLLATAVALGLLAAWIGFALATRRWRAAVPVFWACVAAVSLVAVSQMTSQISRAATAAAQAVNVPVSASGVRPGEPVAVASNVGWQAWVPLAYQVSWTELKVFNPASQPPPAGVTVVEMPWPGGQPAQASWPHAPVGWRVVASNQAGGWVLWRRLERPTSAGDRRLTSVVAVCEHGAECHDGTEPSLASAPEASRAWLLIEHPGPWPREAADARLPAPLRALVVSAVELGIRVQMIRRPGRRQVGDVRRVLAGWTAGREPWLRLGSVSAASPALAERDLKELSAGTTPSFGSPAGEPVFLVCTHGRRSTCCARFGAPLAQALAARHPGQIWETTHVGGHRFAANLVILPHGLYYGPVGLDAATAAISAYQRGAVAPGRYRGRAGQPKPAQEAEHALLTRSGSLPLAALG